jgi:transposase
MLLSDLGCDAVWIRALVRQHGAGAITHQKREIAQGRCASVGISTVAHNLVERFFNNIKQPRPAATRYDMLAANYLAFIQLRIITTLAGR